MDADHFGQFDLRQLLSFRSVASTGSFHEAADRLEYTQSAVSQHIAALEGALGVRLLERSRGRRRVSLTEAGELFLRHVDAVVSRLEAARADMRAYREGATGVLRVGTYQSVGARLLPAVVGRFGALWPGIEVRLTESPTGERLLALVEEGELDLTFTHENPEAIGGPFDGMELLADPFVVVVPKASPLAAGTRPIVATDLGNVGMVTARACRATEAALAALRRGGCDPRIVFQSDDNGTIQAMVRAGLGAALVPLLAVDAADPEVSVVMTELPWRRVGIVWHRDRYRSPASIAFVDLAAELGRKLQVELDEYVEGLRRGLPPFASEPVGPASPTFAAPARDGGAAATL